jgi:hypothetical protein
MQLLTVTPDAGYRLKRGVHRCAPRAKLLHGEMPGGAPSGRAKHAEHGRRPRVHLKRQQALAPPRAVPAGPDNAADHACQLLQVAPVYDSSPCSDICATRFGRVVKHRVVLWKAYL